MEDKLVENIEEKSAECGTINSEAYENYHLNGNTDDEKDTAITKYHIRMSKAIRLFRPALLQKLADNGFEIEYGDNEPGIIEIPSLLHPSNTDAALGVFWMNNHTFRQLSLVEIFEKIQGFMEKFPVHVILLENYEECETSCNPSILCGFWAYLVLNYESGCIPLRNEQDLILCLISLARREQIKDKAPSLARIKEKCENSKDFQRFFVQGLINCGEKKAEMLIQAFSSPFTLMEDLAINQGRKILKIEGFGPRFVADNIMLLTKNMANSVPHKENFSFQD